MRVFIITANWGKGGPGGVASEIYHSLIASGDQCCFAFGRSNVPQNIDTYKIGSIIDTGIHVLSSRVFDNAGFMSYKATKELISKIKDFNPDVINIHNLLGYYLNIPLLFEYIRESGITTYWTVHDVWGMTGHCITGICGRRKFGCGKCPRKKEYPQSYIFDRSWKNLQLKKRYIYGIANLHLIVPSYWMRKMIKKTYLRDYSVEVIPNGIDMEMFKPITSVKREIYGLQDKIVLLAVAGIWTKTKGAEYIYQLSEIMDDSFAFVMIGKNKDRELRNNPRIIHIERTSDRKDLACWYTAADIFINPTMGDNFPTVNLEALACGIPVVTFNTGGSGEAIGKCGSIVDQQDIVAMKKEIEKFSQNRIERDLCRKQAEKYSNKIMCDKYHRLFMKAD